MTLMAVWLMIMLLLTLSYQQEQCEKRGCCWSPLDERNVPWCFFPNNHGYTVESVEKPNDYGKSMFPVSLHPALPLIPLPTWKNVAFYLAHFVNLTAPRSFILSVCLSSSHHLFSFSLTLPKAWFSVKYDMDGISENMIDFAACRFFHFLLDFTASVIHLSYSQGTIGHLKSELKHFQTHCLNSIRTFFEKKKITILGACFMWQRWLYWKMVNA